MKKLISIALVLALLGMSGLAGAEITKDETVYALLDADGAEKSVVVVSHIDTPEAGVYEDYGAYESVYAMLIDAQPEIEDGVIRWTLDADPAGFYAAGSLTGAELPFAVSIQYALDGKVVSPDALAGQTGEVRINIQITPNEQADEAFRTRYLGQVQIPLSLAVASNIVAPGATSALVGRTQTLTYTVLPGQDAEFELMFDATDFSMDAITIASAPADIAGMLDIDTRELLEQVKTASDGARELAEGSQQLADGIASLAEGTKALADNAPALSAGIAQLQEGIGPMMSVVSDLPGQLAPLAEGTDAFADGVTGYVEGANTALDGAAQLAAALSTAAESGTEMAGSITQLQEGLAPVLASLPEADRAALEAQLAGISEGLTAYMQGISRIATEAGALSDGVATLNQGGDALTSGAAQQKEAMAALMEQMNQMGQGSEDMNAALTSLGDGAKKIGEAGVGLNDGMQAMQPEAQKLADGQAAFADGLEEMIGGLDALPMGLLSENTGAIPSFASPEHPARSVQFVYMTEAIAKPEAEAAPAEEEAPKGFWDRLTDLF